MSNSSKMHHQKRRRKSDMDESFHPERVPHQITTTNVRMATDSNLLTRTSWTDAKTALTQIKKGKASGNKASLWLRSKIQSELFKLGCCIQSHAGKVIFVGLLVLACFCVGLKSAKLEGRIEKLWVQEGGKLQTELQYVEDTLGYGAGSTSELIIQTPVNDDSNVLTPDALLTHLEILRNASKVVVERHDVAWELRDLCYAPTIPNTEIYMIDQILENLFPCAVITPLDCFWEGSKLLGPDVYVPLGSDEGSMLLSWSTLNPNKLIRQFRKFKDHFNFKSFEEFMKRAGIDSGYQEKPCLNPNDPNCPRSAPNKYSKQTPDIGGELTGGCYGFASRYMHWPEELVVGGTSKNSTGHITRAKGLQSIVQLMGEKDLYDYHSHTYKIHTLDWSREYAASVLKEWQDKFSQEVQMLVKETRRQHKYRINAFSTSHVDAILEEFSEFSLEKVLIGCGFMIVYAAVTMFRWSDLVRSQSGLGVAGVLLVILTIGPGLGLCALVGIHFNASTSHIVPYLALGLGVDAMFILAHSYSEQWDSTIPDQHRVGEVLKRTGVSVLLTGTCNIAAFLAAAVIPIPALRAFALQAAILIAFNLASMLLIFPAFMAMDLRRVVNKRVDILCCYDGSHDEDEITDLDTVDPRRSQQSLNSNVSTRHLVTSGGGSTPPPSYETVVEDGGVQASEVHDPPQPKFTLGWFAEKYYAPFVTCPPVKVLVVLTGICLTGVGLWAIVRGVKDGLDLTEVVPRNTSVYHFLTDQNKYFGFYHMHAITQGNFEYPQNQALIYDYQNAFVRIPKLIKNDDGGLPEFWLSLFREWLVKLQKAFDDDYARGAIWERDPENGSGPGWDPEEASVDGILAYKLLVQTGHVDYPVDETLLSRNRLVDSHGIINRNAFYNYLSAWYSNDAMAYSYSQANLVPTPKEWYHNSDDHDLLVPKSQPIVYAQIPFYLNNLGNTQEMVEMIIQVRGVCKKFEERGLPNFPAGVPFTFWEQYIGLRFWLGVAVASVLAAVFAAVATVFVNAWLAAVVCVVVASIVVQLFGAMAVLDVHLSAIPAVIIILAVGLGVEFTLHICIGFVTSLGSRQHRVKKSLKHMFAPVFHGAFSTFLSVVMLEFSQFDFIVRYFFYVLTALIVLGVFNGLVFLPVLLLMVGPPPEVVPSSGGASVTRIEPPSPEPSPATVRASHHQATQIGGAAGAGGRGVAATGGSRRSSGGRRDRLSIPVAPPVPPQRHNSDMSLSTIAEESSFASQSSYHPTNYCTSQPTNHQQCQHPSNGGASVFVEPHVVVETTTYPNSGNASNGGSLSRCSTPNQQVTKVTATASFKVEVHSSPQQTLARSSDGACAGGASSSGGGGSGGAAKRSSRSRKSEKGLRVNLPPSPAPQAGGTTSLLYPPPPSSAQSSLSGGDSSVRSSLSNSVSSSLSSDGGFSEK